MFKYIWHHVLEWTSSMCGDTKTITEVSVVATSLEDARNKLLINSDIKQKKELVDCILNQPAHRVPVIPEIRVITEKEYDRAQILRIGKWIDEK